MSESVLCIRWLKYWSFSFNISPSNEYSELISFRVDWFDLTVQETLKSLLKTPQFKSINSSVLSFFRVQLSHPYVTTRKTIGLTRWTFVGKVMSLLFNMLSRLVITFLPKGTCRINSSSQGFNLKRWTVSANETASQFFFWTGSLFQAYDSLLYFYKSIRSEVWYFQFPLTQIYYLHKSLLLFKQSSCFRDSLGISLIIYYLLPLMCPIVNLWLRCNSYYIPLFITYLPKSCLPLTSWAHYLLKRLLAIVSLKIPNFYKL